MSACVFFPFFPIGLEPEQFGKAHDAACQDSHSRLETDKLKVRTVGRLKLEGIDWTFAEAKQ